MKTIAIHLQKGGVGKTSICGLIGHILKEKYKVLLIDADPQSNLSSWFLDEDNVNYELADILIDKKTCQEAIIKKDGIDYIPSCGIGGNLRYYAETTLSDKPFIFCELIDNIKTLGYDFVLYDLSPAISRLEKSILVSCDEVITPITPEYFGIEGLEIFNYTLKILERNYRRKIKHEKIIINTFDKRIAFHLQVKIDSEALNYKTYILPVDQSFNRSQSLHVAPNNIKTIKKETLECINLIIKELEFDLEQDLKNNTI